MRDALEKRPTVNVPNFENTYLDRQVNGLVAPNQHVARLQHVDGWMRGMQAADFANTVATQQLLKRVQELTNQAVV